MICKDCKPRLASFEKVVEYSVNCAEAILAEIRAMSTSESVEDLRAALLGAADMIECLTRELALSDTGWKESIERDKKLSAENASLRQRIAKLEIERREREKQS